MSKLQGPRSNFFLKKATRCELMARISRDARIARNRPQEATCIDKYVRTLIFSMHVRDTNDDGPTDTTRAHNTSTLVLVVRHRDTTLPRAGTHTHHATPPPRHTTDTHARTKDPSDARMRGSHSRSTLNVGVFFVIPVAGAIPHTHPAPPHEHERTHARARTHPRTTQHR